MNISGTVMVVGDVMLDVYVRGDVFRISPEAPVPIVSVTGRTETLGGAGNVVLNLVGLGCQVCLFGMRGDDQAGRTIVEILSQNKVVSGLYVDPYLPTTIKTRIVANRQQLIRYDVERITDGGECGLHIRSAIYENLPMVGAVVLSDYGKGVLSRKLVQNIIARANEMRIPVLVDPKRKDWSFYEGAEVITPNISELEAAVASPCDDDAVVLDAAHQLSDRHCIDTVVVTRGPKGMMVYSRGQHEFIETEAKSVFDVSGAGDTVIATMAACLCSGYSAFKSARIANQAAGIVVGKLGTSPIQIEELRRTTACQTT